MSKVLLTGASGFLGRHCLEFLAGKCEVHAITRNSTLASRLGLHTHQIDLFQQDQVRALLQDIRPSHLLHLAWVASPATYRDSRENLDWLAASLHLLRAFTDNGGQRVVMAGSCAEYDWAHGICDEAATPMRPTTLYGTCKNALREVLEMHARQSGLSAAWGRLFFLYGPGEHPDRFVSYVIRSLLANQPAKCSAGTQCRDYIYVKDAARAFITLLLSSVTGAMNIGTGEAVEVASIARIIGRLTARPELVLLGAVQTGNAEGRLVTAGQRRVAQQLGWLPEITLEQGLTETVEWWKRKLDTKSEGGIADE
jgi:nucleoside-diphosphate-sugar epimerase